MAARGYFEIQHGQKAWTIHWANVVRIYKYFGDSSYEGVMIVLNDATPEVGHYEILTDKYEYEKVVEMHHKAQNEEYNMRLNMRGEQ